MKLIDIVRQASQQPLTTEDGEPAPLVLGPPLADADLHALEAQLPCPIPPEVTELLSFCSGFSGGPIHFVDITARQSIFEFEPAFPHGLPIAADGCGNFWVVDLLPKSTTWGPIYFACHDPPVTLYQSPSLEEFLSELFKLSMPPYNSLVDDVRGDRVFEVWRKNPGVHDYVECMAASDPELSSFARQLGPTFQFVDMRNPAAGFGFCWGRYGPSTVVKRHGDLPIFAYERRKGLLSRLFGSP
jgi:hypothetical protein